MTVLRKLLGRKDADGAHRGVSSLKLGVAFIVLVLVVGAALFGKSRILTTLKPGDTISVHFARNYRLQPYQSQVKIAFAPVGVVTGVEEQTDGSALVTVKLDSGTLPKLRSKPTAVIRPTTLLGGSYFIDLQPGGAAGDLAGGTIPVERTQLPVELGQVAGALQPSALAGLQHTVGNLDQTLRDGGAQAIDQLLADAPGLLVPAADVLEAARGQNPGSDLTELVAGLESTSARLSAQQGQLDSIVTNLHTTSSVLGAESGQIAAAIANLPDTLRSADAGLRRLDTSLGKLRDTADDARPVARQLSETLNHLDPVLVRTDPFLRQTDALLVDAEPLVRQLTPVSRQTTAVLNDLRGPVLDRLNGPVRTFLYSPYHGSGEYAQSHSDVPMYQEIAGAVANLDKTASLFDPNGHAIAIQVGFGLGTAGGLPINLQHFLDQLDQQIQRNQREGR
ncbi:MULTISPECIES: MlaD family protein [Amycolatopsis]|uniref:MlaD family protein n=1 Tax=Amycolatopsis TaxID=1813 RepID=UPI0033BA8CBC